MHNIYIYILIMFLVSFMLRTLPTVLIKKPIENKYVKSFLYYVPYVTLSVMTVPAIINVTDNPYIGLVALVIGILISAIRESVFISAVLCSITVLILELVL